jgi:hypothetical protein
MRVQVLLFGDFDWSKLVEPIRGLAEFFRKTKSQLFYRQMKTPNRVLKTKNTWFFPTPVVRI